MVNLDAPPAASAAECPRCGKSPALCVCAGIEPLDNRIALLILQHPQEQDRELGTARLTLLHLKRATLKTGLSWPSLQKALGPGTWRFELQDKQFLEPGSLSVLEGEPVLVLPDAIVFRLAGRPGEVVAFTFRATVSP